MINVVTASFVATVDEDFDEETDHTYLLGRVQLGNQIVWETRIPYDKDADYVMESFAYELARVINGPGLIA